MFRIFPAGYGNWAGVIHGAWAALVPRPDGNGDEEAVEDAPAKELLLGRAVPSPLEMKPQYPDQTRPSFSRIKLSAPPDCSILRSRRGLESHLVSSSSGGGVPTSASFLSVPAPQTKAPTAEQIEGIRIIFGKKLKRGEVTKNKPLGVSPGTFHSNLQPRTLDFQEGACCPRKQNGAWRNAASSWPFSGTTASNLALRGPSESWGLWGCQWSCPPAMFPNR